MKEASSERDTSWLSATLLALSALSLGHALAINRGMLAPMALLWLSGALGLCATAVAVSRYQPGWISVRRGQLVLSAVLLAGLLLQLLQLAYAPPALRSHLDEVPPNALRGALAAVGGLAAVGTTRVSGMRRIWFPLVLLIFAGLGHLVLQGSPQPAVDVFFFQRDGGAALTEGRNPYAMRFPNIYGPDTPFYGPGLVEDGWLTFGFPYLPLSLLLVLPGHLIAGDVRYANLTALILSGVFIGYARPGAVAALAACVCLFTPVGLLILERSWTEPLVVVLLAATIFLACRAPRAAPYAYGLLLAVKQYMVLAVPLTYMLARATRVELSRLLTIALVIAAAATIPFVLWDPTAFIDSVVTLQFKQPFRTDALSYPAWIVSRGGPRWTGALSFAAAAVALGLVLRFAPRTPAGTAASVAFVYFAFFAWNKQAFANYYFFVIGALCCAVSAAPLKKTEDISTRRAAVVETR
jgi:hypothetical protein